MQDQSCRTTLTVLRWQVDPPTESWLMSDLIAVYSVTLKHLDREVTRVMLTRTPAVLTSFGGENIQS